MLRVRDRFNHSTASKNRKQKQNKPKKQKRSLHHPFLHFLWRLCIFCVCTSHLFLSFVLALFLHLQKGGQFRTIRCFRAHGFLFVLHLQMTHFCIHKNGQFCLCIFVFIFCPTFFASCLGFSSTKTKEKQIKTEDKGRTDTRPKSFSAFAFFMFYAASTISHLHLPYFLYWLHTA